VCGTAYDAVPINVTTVDGKPRPLNPDDEKQVGALCAGGSLRHSSETSETRPVSGLNDS
jgi:hypothetical protein